MRLRLLVSALLTVIICSASAFAQVSKVTPVDPDPQPQPTYDGQCTISHVSHWTQYNWGEWLDDYGYAEFSCSGNFQGQVETELHLEYAPASSYHKFTQAPQGHVYGSHTAPDVPSGSSLWTTAPRNPDFLTRAVATVRWQSGYSCSYHCGPSWSSATLASGWFE